ncbi:hypothetical protein [Lentzea sp. NPDC004782]|jgi:hypothetical protein|uniref:hypothetical protein n=1 Tax=Lentzea sp. NPDC004782 TaxID=3154458 RepID=UPI0033A38F9A
MYAQLTYFDRPRSPEQLAAEDFAVQHRIVPAALAVPGNIRTYSLRRDDGSAVVVSIAETEQALLDTQKAIMSSKLLPGEDPALLTGADRVEICAVHEVFELGEVRS